MKATVEIVKIGPKQAEQLLSSQVKEQRHLRNAYVQTLATDMKDGNFRLSADALVVIKGQLANGQHRMWAVIESNTTQQFLMMDTDDEELYKVLDCGLRRTVGDAAHICNAPSAGAVAMLAIAYKNDGLTTFNVIRSKRPSRIEIIEFLQRNDQEIQDAISIMSHLTNKNQNFAPKTVGAALILLGKPMYGELVSEFMAQVYSGGSPESCCFDLRERFIKMRMSRGKYPSQYYFGLMIKTLNCFIKGTRLGTLRMGEDESFPKIIKPSK